MKAGCSIWANTQGGMGRVHGGGLVLFKAQSHVPRRFTVLLLLILSSELIKLIQMLKLTGDRQKPRKILKKKLNSVLLLFGTAQMHFSFQSQFRPDTSGVYPTPDYPNSSIWGHTVHSSMLNKQRKCLTSRVPLSTPALVKLAKFTLNTCDTSKL